MRTQINSLLPFKNTGKSNKVNNSKIINWVLFIILSFIWGSSFVLMKEGLLHLTAFQVASIRIISSGIVLLPVAIRHFRKIPVNKLHYVFFSGVLGSLLPAYLFCIAEQSIDSSLAGVLNALTPIFVIIMGAVFFQSSTSKTKIIGIGIAFSGSVLLFFSQRNFAENSNAFSVLLVVIATLLYGINVNMVNRYLTSIPSLHIAAVALGLNAIPALIILSITGYFKLALSSKEIIVSTGYSSILGIGGTAIATIMFYMLLKRAGYVFASMVTYAIPIVAIIWGLFYGEEIGWKQFACMGIILVGVWWANRKR